MLNNNQGKQMLINKYIAEATKTELLSYKLVLSSQIIEAQKSLDLIEVELVQQKKPEGRKDQDLIDKKWRAVSELGV